VADLPEKFIQYVRTAMKVKAIINDNEITGTVIAIVPRGDVATRTFPVKIRTPNTLSLIEGMSAKVILPTGERKKTLVVPRAAVVVVFGQTVVYAVQDSKAKMIPVNVVGYEDLNAGIEAQGLAEGMAVVVEGNERLRDGQMVSLVRQKDYNDK
jgi:multidrug efflux pump subunit AcrA (membrane-fusion protein)